MSWWSEMFKAVPCNLTFTTLSIATLSNYLECTSRWSQVVHTSPHIKFTSFFVLFVVRKVGLHLECFTDIFYRYMLRGLEAGSLYEVHIVTLSSDTSAALDQSAYSLYTTFSTKTSGTLFVSQHPSCLLMKKVVSFFIIDMSSGLYCPSPILYLIFVCYEYSPFLRPIKNMT